MLINKSEDQRSSFLSVEKDMNIIIQKIMDNDNLLKLLYYNTPDALSQSVLTEEEKIKVVQEQIITAFSIPFEDHKMAYIQIAFDNFISNEENPQYRDNRIHFSILCSDKIWNLNNFQIRPIKIMGELDKIFNRTKLTGIGQLFFYQAESVITNGDLAGYELEYAAIHGLTEDKIDGMEPIDD